MRRAYDTREIVAALTSGQRNNLPAEVTRFIGRRRELPAIADAIERHRLVTLRGAGGVGKTRLALRVAADLRDSFTDGCWLVQLSPLRAPGLLARTVSEALGLPDEAAGDAPRVLAQNLAERELLLVLDTCEHLSDACAELAALLPAGQALGWHEDPATLEPHEIAALLGDDDVVVVKGSKKMFWVNKFVPRLVAALQSRARA